MKHLSSIFILLALGAFVNAANSADEKPLAENDFVRVTLIDRAKRRMDIYTATARGEVVLPELGSIHFAGLKPSEFATWVKGAYIERGPHTADTLNVLLEYGPPSKRPVRIIGSSVKRDEAPWSEGMTVYGAALAGGGLSGFGSRKGHILRVLEDGSTRKIQFDLTHSRKDPKLDPKVQPGDVIVFEEKWFSF